MTLQTSGPMGLYDIRREIRGTADTAQIALLDANVRQLANQPSGDVIMPTEFYGKSVVPPPVANFTGTPVTGIVPLTVTFQDLSTNTPTSWEWDFNNDGTVDSTVKNPTHTYTTVGTYSVKLKATNQGGNNTLTRTNYITVNSLSSVKVAIFGDSVSTYGGVTLIPGYPINQDSSYQLSQDGSITSVIQKLYPNYTVINVSRGGMTTLEALGQVPSMGNNPFGASGTITQWITNNNPSKIVLRYGLADSVLYADAQTTLSNIESIINYAQGLGIEVILINVNHIATPDDPVNPGYYPSGTTTSAMVNAAASISAGIASIASNLGLKYADPRAVTAPSKSLPDGIHPYRNFGYKITREILGQLRPQVPTSEQGTVPTQSYYFTSPGINGSVVEGNTVSFIVQTTGVPQGTVLYWAAASDTGGQPGDVSIPSPPLGSVTIGSGGSGVISLTVDRDDATPETDESLYIDLYLTQADRDAFTNPIALSNVVSVINNPYNEIVSGPSSVVAGNAFSVGINGGKPNALFVYQKDFIPGDYQTANLDGLGNYTFTNQQIFSTGTYSFTFTFGTAPYTRVRNYTVQITAPVTYNESIIGPYSVQEGEYFTVYVTGGQPNTQFVYSKDFIPGDYQTATLNGAGEYYFYNQQIFTAGTYGFTFTFDGSRIRNYSVIVVAAPPPPPPPPPPPSPAYAFTNPTGDVSVSEGSTVSFTVGTSNVSQGTVLYWAAIAVGGASPGDASDPFPPLGSITIGSNGTASINLTAATDMVTPESGEGLKLRVYLTASDRDSFVNHVAESPVAYIIDVPPVQYEISTYGIFTLTEGESIDFLITALPYSPGSTIWWTTTGVAPAASPADILSPFPPLGSVTLNSNRQATVTFTAKSDGISEPSGERFYLSIHPTQAERDSYTSNVNSVTPLAISQTITVYDNYGN